jgi:hypothetical protein
MATAKKVEDNRNIPAVSVGEFGNIVTSYYKSVKPRLAKPFLAVGPVGCGKTEVWRDVGRRLDVPTIMRHLSQVHPLDMGGVIADVATRSLIFAKSPLVQEVEQAIIDAGKRGPALLVLDELDRVQAMALNSCLQIMSERRQNGYDMGDVYIGAAANGWHDIHTFELSKAALSRLAIMSVEPNPSEWLLWAAEHNIDNRILLAINMAPQILNQHNGELPDSLWKVADPRAWADLSNAISADQGLSVEHAAAFVGLHAAKTFSQYASFSRDYEKEIKSLLAGKKIENDNPSVLFGCYLGAAGQTRDNEQAYKILKNSCSQIGDEKSYIVGRIMTYQLGGAESMCKHPGIRDLHVKLWEATRPKTDKDTK